MRKSFVIPYFEYAYVGKGCILKLLIELKVLKYYELEFIYPQAPSSADDDKPIAIKVTL